jgi:outer membrane lipoprotein-sorting protein
MRRLVRLGVSALSCCAFALVVAVASRADEPAAPQSEQLAAGVTPNTLAFDPTELAESYFEQSERFDALLTYEVKRGPAGALFSIARHWDDGLAKLLFYVREPESFEKWAMLMLENHGGSDDLFFYAGDDTGRRVRRLASSQLERQAIFELIALGDYRPTARGELSYAAGVDETIDDVLCHVVVARTPQPVLGFDELQLVFAAKERLLLQSRFYRSDKEVRRLTTTLADYQDVGAHKLAMRWTARRWADGGETEIVLRHVVETAELPDGLFSQRKLSTQHFPEF